MNLFTLTCCRRFAAGPSRPSPLSLTAPFRIAQPRALWSPSTRLHTAASQSVSFAQTPSIPASGWPFLRTFRGTFRDRLGRPSGRSASSGGRGPKTPYRPPPPPPPHPSRPPSQPWWQPWFSNFVRRLDRLPHKAVAYTLIGLNLAVYLLWKLGDNNYYRFKDPALLYFLLRNFTASWENFKHNRIWTLVTAAFSQREETHLFVNLLVLFISAADIMSVIGVARFLGVYLVGGAVSSIVSVWWRGNKPGFSLGASGATYSTFSLFACLFPQARFLVFFVLPLPAWACMGGLFCWDFYNMITQPRVYSGTDTAGHVGGMLAGVAMYFFLFRRLV